MDVSYRAYRELDRLITKWHDPRDGEGDPLEPSYLESVRRFNARREEEHRQAWAEYHRSQAERMRTLLTGLIARHEELAQQLMEGEEV